MYHKKKNKLYISELIDSPAVAYPAYYVLSTSMYKNEMLRAALIAVHSFDFSSYGYAKNFEDIFTMCGMGDYPIYKEKYIVGYFGYRMMYLEGTGWKGMPATKEIFKLENWFVSEDK